MSKYPRLLFGATASGSGKTTITCGVLQALVNRGMKVASFKCGPDYIDPMFHSRVIGTKSRNLDTFFTGEELTRYLFMENAGDMEISVMEGVMGYYDGVGGTTTQASSYELASMTRTPAVLILNGRGMSLSMAAVVKGFLEYREDSMIQGVILNQISPMIYQRMKQVIEEETHVRVYGYVPVMKDNVIDSRHLGLVMPDEIPSLKQQLQSTAKILEQTLDLNGLLALAESAPPLEEVSLAEVDRDFLFTLPEPIKIGVASDEAFCFFYEDNFRLLQQMGAQLVPFSPVHDERLPKGIQGILMYGGYPELYGKELSENRSMKESIAQKIADGMPCMAECGGFMYLHEQMQDMKDKMRDMVGVIPGQVYRTPELKRFGYTTLTLGDPVFEEDVGNLPAHEFHYFDSDNCGDGFLARKPMASRTWNCMHVGPTFFAGFPHFHYYANPKLPIAFLKACAKYKSSHQKG